MASIVELIYRHCITKLKKHIIKKSQWVTKPLKQLLSCLYPKIKEHLLKGGVPGNLTFVSGSNFIWRVYPVFIEYGAWFILQQVCGTFLFTLSQNNKFKWSQSVKEPCRAYKLHSATGSNWKHVDEKGRGDTNRLAIVTSSIEISGFHINVGQRGILGYHHDEKTCLCALKSYWKREMKRQISELNRPQLSSQCSSESRRQMLTMFAIIAHVTIETAVYGITI